MMKKSHPTKHGSVYIITLFTVAAIVSMVLIGVRLRLATNSQSAIIEQMSEGSTDILDATEFALQTITDDPNWNTTSQSGTVFAPFTLGETTYSSTVLDASTGLTTTNSTTNYRVNLKAEHLTAKSLAQIEVLGSTVDYLSVLNNLGATHYWPLNEANRSTTAVDQLPDNINGTYLIPAAAGASTNDEGALVPVFDDANDQVEVPWSGTFKARNGSISLWIKATSQSSLSTRGILGMLYKSGGKPTLALSTRNGDLSAFVDDTGSFSFGDTTTSSSGIVTLNTWHHVTVTWGADGLFIYLDGVEVSKNTGNTMGVDTASTSKGGEQPLNIGSGYIVLLSTYEIGFQGSLAHVVFFTNQLRAAQVAELAAIKPDLINYTIVEDSWVRVFE